MEKLAIDGGNPVRTLPLPYGNQWIEADDCKAIVEVITSPLITTGPKVKEFEEAMASYVNTKYAVAFSNGTAALHGACYAAGIGEGDEAIVTPMTFAASSNCVLFQGGTVVFADINENNYNICPNEIEKKITDNTKIIIAVDYTGQAVDIDRIKQVVGNRNIIIIEDGAHALGTEYKGARVGSLADMTMFSFHPVKTITTGEGGIITTNNEVYYNKLVSFRGHCITKEKSQFRYQNEGSWYYEQIDLGYNYRLTDFQAALGLNQLNKIDKFINRRKEIVKAYNKKLSKIDGIFLPKNETYSDTSNHLYVIRIDLDKFKVGRRQIFDAIIAEGIGVHVHYIPVYWHPYYQSLGYKRGLCPVAEKLYTEMLTLPLFPKMTDNDVDDVVEGLDKVIQCYKK